MTSITAITAITATARCLVTALSIAAVAPAWGQETPLADSTDATAFAASVTTAGAAAAVSFDSGQIATPSPAPPIPEHTGIKAMFYEFGHDLRHLSSIENLSWAAAGGGLASAARPLDKTANADLSGPFLDKFFKPGAILGQSYTLLPVAATIYAVGRAKGNARMSHMGSDLIQSLLLAELVTQSLKHAVGRERPDGSGPTSFPSGHASGTMAFATALERHFNWKYYLPAYAAASYVAISRVHDNRHYFSDVMAGTAVGIIAGRTVTRTGHRPFPVQAVSVSGGFAVVYVRQGDDRNE
jgi:membrane-associated phospholipid phosphatase